MTHSFPTRRSSDLTPKEFEGSDIIAHALAALSVSQVKHIHIVGRRGPHQIAMTPKELGELGELARAVPHVRPEDLRSEEHTSELQSLMRISYAVFCLKKKKTTTQPTANHNE